MLEIDWWKRPSARDVLGALESLSDRTTSICVFNTGETELQDAEGIDFWNLESKNDHETPDLPTVLEDSLNAVLEAPQKITLDSTNPAWAKTAWRPCWYILYVPFLIFSSKRCRFIVESGSVRPKSQREKLRYDCGCSGAQQPIIRWEFVLDSTYLEQASRYPTHTTFPSSQQTTTTGLSAITPNLLLDKSTQGTVHIH